MKAFLVFLMLAFSFPVVAAEEKQAEKKTEKKAAKKSGKKPEKKPVKTEKTTAQPKQDWGRFSSNASKDEAERARQAQKKQ